MPKTPKTRTVTSRVDPVTGTPRPVSKPRGDKPWNRANAEWHIKKLLQNASAIEKEAEEASESNKTRFLFLVNQGCDGTTARRLLAVPSSFTLADFHKVLQISLGFHDDHLYEFQVMIAKGNRNTRYNKSKLLATINSRGPRAPIDKFGDGPQLKADDITLHDVFDPRKRWEKEDWGQWDFENDAPTQVVYRGAVELHYTYDLGDNWTPKIEFLGPLEPDIARNLRVPNNHAAVCIAGDGDFIDEYPKPLEFENDDGYMVMADGEYEENEECIWDFDALNERLKALAEGDESLLCLSKTVLLEQ